MAVTEKYSWDKGLRPHEAIGVYEITPYTPTNDERRDFDG